jgi:hypothetical protein
MKEITLKFREVAVDGLPEKSCKVLTLSGYACEDTGRVEHFYNIIGVDFSAKHGKFNAYDTIEEDPKSVFSDDVLFWCPVSEVDAILKEDAQDVQTLD